MATNNEIGIKLTVSGEQQVKTALSGVEDRMERLTGAVSRAGHYGAAFLAITQGLIPVAQAAVRAADAVTTLNNQLKLATGSTQAAGKAYEALFEIAQRSSVSFTDLGGTFASISRAGQELGLSQQRLLTVTEAIGNAMTISGGNAEGMNAALVQLGQGLASGTLRGEELNSVMEQTPRLAKAIADGLGVPIGKLREMGAAGEISAEQVVRALEKQSAVLRGEVAGAALTVGQAMTQLQNAAIKAAGDFDTATGATALLASSLTGLASGIVTIGQAANENEVAIKTVIGGLAAGAAVSGAAALASGIGKVAVAVRVLGVALAANPYVLALMGIGALVAGVSAASEAKSKTLDGMKATLRELESLEKRGNTGIYGNKVSDEALTKRREEIKRLRGEIALLDNANLDTRAEDARMAAMVKNTKAADADREAYAKLSRELGGFKGNYKEYTDNVALINRLRASGAITEKEAAKRLEELAKKHGLTAKEVKANKEAERELAEQRKNDLKVGELRNKQIDDRLKFEAELTKQQAAVVAQEYENADATIAQALARELANDKTVDATLATQQLTLAQLEQQRLDLEATDNVIPGYIQALEARIAAQKRLISATQTGITQEASEKAAKETVDAWRKASDKIEDALTDALMRGFESGKDFARNLVDTLKNMFNTLVLRPVIQAVINPVAGALTGALGLPGAASASQVGQGANPMSLASSANSAYNLLTTGIRDSIANGFTKLASSNLGQQLGLYDADAGVRGLTGTGQSISSGLQSAGGSLMAYGLSKGLSGGYQVGNGKIMDAATLVAGWFDPTGGLIAGAVSGAINRAFGRKLADSGLQGTFGGDEGFSGSNYEFYKGGWFRSDKTKTRALDPEIETALADQFRALQASTGLMATTLGLGTDAIAGFTSSIKLSFQGLTEEQIQTQLAEEFAKVGESLASTALGTERYTRAGETALQTLQRLSSSLSAVNGTFDVLGRTLYAASLSGSDMASSLVDLMGGLEQYQAITTAYYQAYYTEAERNATATRQLTESLAALGLSLPATREAYRDLVEAQDLSTDAGRRTYAALLGLSTQFDSITPKLDTLAGKFGSLVAGLSDEATRLIDSQIQLSQGAARTAREASDAYRAAMTDLRSAAESILLQRTGGLQSARTAYQAQLTRAQGGDVKAMQALPTLADALIAETKNSSRSAAEFAVASAQVANQLNGVAAVADVLGVGADYQAMLFDVNTSLLEVTREQLASGNLTVELLQQIQGALGKVDGSIKASSDLTVGVMQTGNGGIVGALVDNAGNVVAGLNSTTVLQLVGMQNQNAAAAAQAQAMQAATWGAAGLQVDRAAGDTGWLSGQIGGALWGTADWQRQAAYDVNSSQWQAANMLDGTMHSQTVSLGGLNQNQIGQLQGLASTQSKALGLTDVVAQVTGENTSLSSAILKQLQTPDASAEFLAKTIGLGNNYIADRLDGIIAAINQQTLEQQAELKRQQQALAINKLQDELGATTGNSRKARQEEDSRWENVWNWSGKDLGSWTTYRDRINNGTWWERDSDFRGAYGVDFSEWYRQTLGYGSYSAQEDMRAQNLREQIKNLGGVPAFATGGTFRNGVVDTPTMAPMALFGEAGPEAIMPLARGPGGMLGVRMHGGSGQGDSGSSASEHLLRSLVDEVRRLSVDLQATKQEISGMRRDNNIGNAEIAASTKKVARLQEKFEAVGMPTIPA